MLISTPPQDVFIPFASENPEIEINQVLLCKVNYEYLGLVLSTVILKHNLRANMLSNLKVSELIDLIVHLVFQRNIRSTCVCIYRIVHSNIGLVY